MNNLSVHATSPRPLLRSTTSTSQTAAAQATSAFRSCSFWPSKACASPPPAFVLIYLADNDYNAGIHDAAVTKAERGCDVVCASRFMPGGGMVSCPWPERRFWFAWPASPNIILPGFRRGTPATGLDCFPGVRSRRLRSSPARVLLQHRTACDGSPPRLADRRGTRAVVSAQTRLESISGAAVAAGLLALVFLCLCDDLAPASGNVSPALLLKTG